tara:strand:+ start:3174 stop:3767 length:594 start_codon:yes stop_codon:yes gene_type:complete
MNYLFLGVNGGIGESILNKISEIIKNFKSIDILINSVGNANPYKSALEMKLNEIEQSMRINFYSALFIILQVIKKSIKIKKKLNIINISSNTIKFYGSNNNLPYLVSKNALEVALLNLSKTYSRKLIKINIIRPGLIDSNKKNNLKNYSQKIFLKRQKLVPIGKAGDPEDISNLVNFLISNNSKFIFGQIFTVSGGE